MFKQYHTRPVWDTTLAIVGTVELYISGVLMELVSSGVKDTTGAPTATANRFMRGAIIQNSFSGINYQNTGTVASPVWSVIDVSSGGLPALADGKIWAGNASNVATAVTPSGDVTMANTGAFTIADNSVTGAKIAIASQSAGSMMYYNGTDWINIAPGTEGQVLTFTSGVPTWTT